MRSFNEICKSINFSHRETCPFVDPAPTYNAYKNGQCTNFADREQANKFSKLIETVFVKNPDREKWFEEARIQEGRAIEIFHNDLREEYSDVPDEIYDLCYSKAYDRGHHAGFDEVASYLNETIDFANEIKDHYLSKTKV